MLRCLLIATIALVLYTSYAQPQYHLQHFGSDDGLASAYAQTIAQDSLGFLWIQYPGGLTRFDGYDFRLYKHDPNNTNRSPGAGALSALVTDHQGNVWVLGGYHEPFFTLAKYNRQTDGFTKYRIRITFRIEGPNDDGAIQSVRFERSGDSLWVATRSGLYCFNIRNQKTTHYLNNHRDCAGLSLCNFITDISIRDSSLLLSSRNGLWRFDKKRKQFSRPECHASDSPWLYRSEIWEICEAPNYNPDDVWLVGNDGFFKVNKDLSIVQRLNLPGGLHGFGVFNYVRDKTGAFWIASVTKGLYKYDPAYGSFQNVNDLIDGAPFFDNVVNSAFVDKDNNIWVATDRGVTKLQKRQLNFYNHRIPKGDSSVVFSGIHSSIVYKTRNADHLLINQYKINDIHEILLAPITPDRLDSLKFATVIPALEGRAVNNFWQGKHNFWISVWGTGVTGVPIDPETGMIRTEPLKVFAHDPANTNTITSNFSSSVMEDANGDLWVGSHGKGLNKIALTRPYGDQGSVIRYQHKQADSTSIASNVVYALHPDNENTLWVTTDRGVDLFKNGQFEHVFKNENRPRAFHKTAGGDVFIGTSAGLYEGKKVLGQYTFKKIAITKDEDILAIQGDKVGRLWLSTTQGIVCYDPDESTAMEFTEKDGMAHWRSMYSNYAAYETRHGAIAVSDYDGISIFDPLSFRFSRKTTVPQLTKLAVNNQPPVIGAHTVDGDEFAIDADITILDELTLDYKHNNFSIEFSAMELISPNKNLYRHKLEGYDEEWIQTDAGSRTATYTNLDAGTYVFKVKASNYHGIWNDNEKHLSVVILPPPWLTWWAYLLYGLFSLAVILYWRSYEIKRIRLKQRAAHLTEMDRLKTRFFANISHEFRTPITLILGPLKELYHITASDDQRSLFAIMIRNAERLLQLINELLDLSKIEAGKMHLRLTKVDLVNLLREIASAYEPIAKDKNLRYVFYPEVPELMMPVDPEKIEKIIHNLLSNAFKFTTHGQVIITLKTKDKHWAQITVMDTGAGIAREEHEKIFDRFYQVDSSQTRGHEGSGLGMALARELVELHHGSISVESTPGNGTLFTVLLPISKNIFPVEKIIDPDHQAKNGTTTDYRRDEGCLVPATVHPDASINDETVNAINDETVNAIGREPLVLVVEDNADMRHYIRRMLSEQYYILEATDGSEGLLKATERIPDLIISDIMMPEMDGYKFCESIKNTEATSHIPVILLTAKADRDSKIMGLQTRADDYLTKPFDGDELRLIIRNRIQERTKLRERFSREITLEPQQIAITSLDEKFLARVMQIIDAHIDDEQFSIAALSDHAGYSQMQLYRKIKGLTGQSPNYFVRTIRLKRAAELLRHKSDNVAQIAYSVGFSSPSYFIKCFKEQFGVTPGEFMQQP